VGEIVFLLKLFLTLAAVAVAVVAVAAAAVAVAVAVRRRRLAAAAVAAAAVAAATVAEALAVAVAAAAVAEAVAAPLPRRRRRRGRRRRAAAAARSDRLGGPKTWCASCARAQVRRGGGRARPVAASSLCVRLSEHVHARRRLVGGSRAAARSDRASRWTENVGAVCVMRARIEVRRGGGRARPVAASSLCVRLSEHVHARRRLVGGMRLRCSTFSGCEQ